MPKHIRYGSELHFTGWPKVSAPVNQLDATDSCSPNGAIEHIAGMKNGSEFTVPVIWSGPVDPDWGYAAGSLSAVHASAVLEGMLRAGLLRLNRERCENTPPQLERSSR